jgi:hypothetical protein
VWSKERVELWSANYQRALVDAREAAGGRWVNPLKVWESTPRPSPVMVWTPAQLGCSWRARPETGCTPSSI